MERTHHPLLLAVLAAILVNILALLNVDRGPWTVDRHDQVEIYLRSHMIK